MTSSSSSSSSSSTEEAQNRDTAPPPASEERSGLPFDPVLLVVVAVALVGLCLVCFFGYLIVQDMTGGNNDTAVDDPATSETEDGGWLDWLFGSDPTPTPVVTGTLTLDQPVLDIAISGSEPVTLTMDAPTELELGTQRFAVVPQRVDNTQPMWLVSQDDGAALWAHGTVINYVMGLPGTADNLTRLESLEPGTRLAFTARDSQSYEFVMTQREWSTQPLAELLSQTRPGLTILWLGQDDAGATLVLRGEYVLNEEEANRATEVVTAELGEPAQLGNARFTVTGATHVTDQPNVPAGFAYYLVDFTLENVGQTPIDTGLWRFTLVDDFGTQYTVNPQAAALGTHPPLPGTVAVGSQVQATAGYQIPANLSSTLLRWLITRVDGPGEIEVQIPFRSGGGESVSQITLQQASVSPDNTSLIVQGQIFNQGGQALTVTEADVRLESEGTAFFILSTSPAFPWSVPPGQTTQFLLTFQRPGTDTATLTLLNQSFLLSGLR